MQLSSEGVLCIRISTAGGAVPLRDINVRIRGAEEENAEVDYSLLSDASGALPDLTLPAPAAVYSQESMPAEAPFAAYDLEVYGRDYAALRLRNVPVFSGIRSWQGIELIPLAPYHAGARESADIRIPNASVTEGGGV